MPDITPVNVTVTENTNDPWTLNAADTQIYPAGEAQIIQWNLTLSGSNQTSGAFEAIASPMTSASGFSWTSASEEGQIDPFSVAVRINSNMSILIVDFHHDPSTQLNFSYMLRATVVDANGVSHACQTNPLSTKGTQGDPCIKNN